MVSSWIENIFKSVSDDLMAALPRALPSREKLEECRIISHRGEHDNRRILENTLAAFDRVRDCGVWGIELDVRWTKDLQPIVFHDADFQRMFGSISMLNCMTMAEIRSEYPMIPSLEEVILRYGKKLHLMIEIKMEAYPDPAYQSQVMSNLLSQLEPIEDFHIISMDPEMFEFIHFVPSKTFLPIAETNVRLLTEMAVTENYGGIVGHYFFITERVKTRHQ
ncbi:MAG: glycerophosphodiester phosphodiesterase, partial [Deltaproteobacteria bacterium]|nr:glycerophosphodiester phosphodiesterase [Deltaproteobacteria bacterium]